MAADAMCSCATFSPPFLHASPILSTKGTITSFSNLTWPNTTEPSSSTPSSPAVSIVATAAYARSTIPDGSAGPAARTPPNRPAPRSSATNPDNCESVRFATSPMLWPMSVAAFSKARRSMSAAE